MKKYNVIEAAPMLLDLNDWYFNSDGIEKKFQFKNYIEALGFIVKVGVVSEKMNHHPELFNVYSKVNIRLTTHDAGGVTDKDFILASEIDHFFSI
ncbi:MAG: 4a-hydroxytetrahydrobiopterin dehydratase [Flavobacteriaceae bacterium]|nr:4a-hydroxytetrahydrobiopterin dehydratase [Flavobacteriaceae bacterium]